MGLFSFFKKKKTEEQPTTTSSDNTKTARPTATATPSVTTTAAAVAKNNGAANTVDDGYDYDFYNEMLKICKESNDFDCSSPMFYCPNFKISDGVTIRAYNGTSKNVIIPETINGQPVTSISYGANRYVTYNLDFGPVHQIENVIIPKTVEAIDISFFEGIKNLCFAPGSRFKYIYEKTTSIVLNLEKANFPENTDYYSLIRKMDINNSPLLKGYEKREDGGLYFHNLLVGESKPIEVLDIKDSKMISLNWMKDDDCINKIIIEPNVTEILLPRVSKWRKGIGDFEVAGNPNYLVEGGVLYKINGKNKEMLFANKFNVDEEITIDSDTISMKQILSPNVKRVIINAKITIPDGCFNLNAIEEIVINNTKTKIKSSSFDGPSSRTVTVYCNADQAKTLKLKNVIIKPLEEYSDQSLVKSTQEKTAIANARKNTPKPTQKTEVENTQVATPSLTPLYKKYKADEKFIEHFYKKTKAPKGTLDICLSAYDRLTNEQKKIFVTSDEDPYGLIDLFTGIEDGVTIPTIILSMEALTYYKDSKYNACMQYMGKCFIRERESNGCLEYLAWLFQKEIIDRETKKCLQVAHESQEPQAQTMLSLFDIYLKDKYELSFNVEKLTTSTTKDTLTKMLKKAGDENDYEGYIYLCMFMKYHGYDIDEAKLKEICQNAGCPRVYKLFTGNEIKTNLDIRDEFGYLEYCMNMRDNNTWKESWLALMYAFAQNTDFKKIYRRFTYVMSKIFESREQYNKKYRDMATAMALKWYYANLANNEHDMENAETNFNLVSGAYYGQDCPKLKTLPDKSLIEQACCYGPLGKIFEKTVQVKSFSLGADVKNKTATELKTLLKSAVENKMYGSYFYLTGLLIKKGEKINETEFASACAKAELNEFADFSTLRNKPSPQGNFDYKAISESKQKLAGKVLSVASENDFADWDEFWIRVFYEYSQKVLGGAIYPFKELLLKVMQTRDVEDPNYFDFPSFSFAMLDYLIEYSQNCGDSASAEDYKSNRTNIFLQYMLSGQSFPAKYNHKQIEEIFYRNIFYDKDHAEIIKSIGTELVPKGDFIKIDLELTNGKRSKGCLKYTSTVSIKNLKSDAIEFNDLTIDGCGNMIRRGLFAQVSGDSCSIEFSGKMSIGTKKYSIGGNLLVDKSYDTCARLFNIDINVTNTEKIEDYTVMTIEIELY